MNNQSLTLSNALDRQDQLWSQGKYVLVEQILNDFPSLSGDEDAILELIWNERELRRELQSEQESEFLRQEYRQRFQWLIPKIDRQFSLERALGQYGNLPQDSKAVSTHEPDNTPTIEAVFPNHQIIEEFASGAFGRVFRAKQILPEREVALKVLRDKGKFNLARIERFHREAQRVAKLRHVNIVEIYEVGTFQGVPYFSMPFIKSGSLASRVAEYKGRYRDIAELIISIALAVDYAHSLNVLHCDIKPANVLIDDGRPLLTDFGLAVSHIMEPATGGPNGFNSNDSSLAGTGGTPVYMAPEQWSGLRSNLAPSTDVYGLGALMYNLLTGQPPGCKDNWIDTIPPSKNDRNIPRDVEAICLKCLAREKSDRYLTAAALVKDLQRFLDGLPVEARPLEGLTGIPERLGKWVLRAPWMATSVLTLSAILVCAPIIQAVYNTQLQAKNRQIDTALTEAERQRDAAATVSFDLAKLTEERASKPEAAKAYQYTLALFEELVNCNPANDFYRIKLAKTRNNLAVLYGELGSVDDAERLLLGAISNLVDIPGESSEIANFHANLGNLYLRQNRFLDATEQYSRAEQLRIRLAMDNPSDKEKQFAVAKSDQDFGNAYRNQNGKATEAIARFENAINKMTLLANKGLLTIELFDRMSQSSLMLANLYVDHGRVADAEKLYHEAIRVYERLLRVEPNITQLKKCYAASHANLGIFYLDTGLADLGISSLNKAINLCREVINLGGQNTYAHAQLAICLNNILRGYVLKYQQSFAPELVVKARAIASESREIIKQLKEANILDIELADSEVNLYINLGILAHAEGNLREARSCYDKAFSLAKSINRLSADLTRLTLLNNLGRLCLDIPDLDAAASYFNSGVKVGRDLMVKNPLNISIIANLMLIQDGLGLLVLRQHQKILPLDRSSPMARKLLKEAATFFGEAISFGDLLAKSGYLKSSHYNTVISIYARRALVFGDLEEFDSAMTDWATIYSMVGEANPQYALYTVAMASFFAKKGNHACAITALEKVGSDIWQHQPMLGYDVACAYALAYKAVASDISLPESERKRLGHEYVRGAIEMLKHLRTGGYFRLSNNVEALNNDSDFDSIRQLNEFKEIQKAISDNANVGS